MSTADSDKRRYFRIVDYIGVCYRLIDEAEYDTLKVASRYADVPSLDALSSLDRRIQLVLDRLKIQNKDVAELGKLLDRKLDILLKNSDLKRGISKLENIPKMQVDISATGMAFPAQGSMSEGQFLEMDLVLQAGAQHMRLLARVVKCESGTGELGGEDATYTHLIRTEFVDISDSIQEYLIQYVVKRQGALLKANRENRRHLKR